MIQYSKLIKLTSIIVTLFYFSVDILGGSTSTLNMRIGDTFTVNTTAHNYTQSVLWQYDPAIVEPQTTIYATTTSVRFKAKSNLVSRSTITATTYYYKSATTSSGVNKDVDVWYVDLQGGSGGLDNTTVSLHLPSLSMTEGKWTSLIAYPSSNAYTGHYHWTTSNSNVVEITPQGPKVDLHALSAGTAYVTVTLDNGNSDNVCVSVAANQSEAAKLIFTLTSDGEGYVVTANKNYEQPTNIIIPSVYNGKPVTMIGDYAFSSLPEIESMDIPNTVNEIGESAFFNCENLKSVHISNSVSVIRKRAFGGCYKLESITIPNTITAIEPSTFAGCPIKLINIPNTVRSIGEFAFENCEYLESITIPSSVTSIDAYAFQNCSSLKSIKIPDSVVSLGNGVFAGCEGLSAIEIPNSVIKFGSTMFHHCSNLISVKLPSRITELGAQTFWYCLNLKSVIIPSSVTTIGRWAFYNCTSLRSIEIPGSVTSIGEDAFKGCKELIEINYITSDPINAERGIFEEEVFEKGCLNLEIGGRDKALKIEPWRYFQNIQERELSDISVVSVDFDDTVPVEVYDLNGIRVADSIKNLSSGLYIIRQGRMTKKVIVK